MRPGFFFKASALVLTSFVAICGAEAKDCPQLNPNRERATLKAYFKENGYTASQITHSMAYADARALSWEKTRLNDKGRECGRGIIQGMIYGCMVDALPPLVKPSIPELSKPIQDKAVLKKLGVKQITVGESLALGVAALCNGHAIEAFAER